MRSTFFLAAAFVGSVVACPDHGGLWKRSGDAEYDYHFPQDWVNTRSDSVETDETFANTSEQGHLSEDYELCATGSQQSPINLSRKTGASQVHKPTFDYPPRINGTLENSGFSLSYTLVGGQEGAVAPTLSFQEDGETHNVTLIGWHTHAPSEHKIDGVRARAELHFVHADADGNPRSVVAFLIQPLPDNNGSSDPFFDSIPRPFPAIGSEEQTTLVLAPTFILNETFLETFWTYKGSLTTPPCTEGLRWFVAQQPLEVDNDTLQAILRVSMYSARPAQAMWRQGLNE